MTTTTDYAAFQVRVENPTPAWIVRNRNSNLPCFTFIKPEPISLEDAQELKASADICCGGTLRIEPA
jgi:hypothetical protein